MKDFYEDKKTSKALEKAFSNAIHNFKALKKAFPNKTDLEIGQMLGWSAEQISVILASLEASGA